MKKRLFSWLAAAVMLVFTALPVTAAINWDGYFTNLFFKGYLGGPKGDTMDNMTANYWKFNGASGSSIFNILTGNLKVGNGTNDVTLNGEDAYIEGTLEVDGVARFDATTITLRGVTYTLPSADGGAGTYLSTNGSATLSWAAGTSGTLDQAYDTGGAGAGKAITVDSGAVALTNNAANNNGVLTVEKSPSGGQSGDLVTITAGANASGDCIQFANSGSGNDLAGTGATWSVTKAGAATFASGTFTNVTTTNWYQTGIIAAAAGNANLTVDAAGNGTITIGGTSTGNTVFPGVVTFNGNVDIGNAATDTLTITSIIDSNVTLDDGVTDSPQLIFKDATDQTASIYKADSGDLTFTMGAATENVYIVSGNLKVGNGSPGTAAMNGDDAYIKGQLEVDGAIQLDGALTAAGTATFSDTVAINGAPTITNVEASYTTNADDQFAFARNQGTTTKPLVAITTAAASDDAAALAVTSGATAGVDAVTISNAGTAAGLHVTTTAAAGTAIDIDVANAMTGRAIYGDLGPWVGTAGAGAIELVSDGDATVVAGQLLRLSQLGTGKHAAAIDGSVIYVADAATAPDAGTSYAVKINPTNIASLHAVTAAQFDTTITATGLITANGGLAVNEDIAVTLDAHDEEVVITASDTDYAANSAITQIKRTAAQDNASYLLALDDNIDGDAQNDFLVCRDNAYTDVKFKIDSGGATTIAGLLTLSAGVTVTGATNLTAAVLAGASPLILDGDTADGTNRVTVAVTDPTAARTLTIPDASGTVALNGTASHDYGAGHVTWTLSAAELQASYITVTNADAGCTATITTPVPGKTYTIYNNSGQTLTFKVTGQTGGTVATGKVAFYTSTTVDVFEVYEQP